MPKKTISVRGVMAIVAAALVAGQLLLGGVVGWRQAKVGFAGDAWNDVVLAKDLVADVLPPPEYLVEAHLVAYQAALTTDPAERARALTTLTRLESEFRTRHDYWAENLPDGQLRTLLLEDAWAPGVRYFALVSGRFGPALTAGDSAAAVAVLSGPMSAEYAQHRAAIDKVVSGSNSWLIETQSAAAANDASARQIYLACAALNALLGVTVALAFASGLDKRLAAATQALGKLANRDLTVRAEAIGEREFQALAGAVNHTVERLRTDVGSYLGTAGSVAEASRRIRAMSGDLGGISSKNLSQADTVNTLADSVVGQLHVVAGAAEEMSATVRAISGNTTEAARVAGAAVSTADAANQTVGRLAQSSNEIGAVVKVINTIAAQTNLLALNATIEAARAGEAGKGFAVVANEVKELARQTTLATEEITRRVEAIQTDSGQTITAITTIHQVIQKVHQLQDSIAAAVGQQSATTNEISRAVAEAAASSEGIASAAQASVSGARSVANSAERLDQEGAKLDALAGNLRDQAAGWRTAAPSERTPGAA
jgi:methyl-accepting chemotaxis protein